MNRSCQKYKKEANMLKLPTIDWQMPGPRTIKTGIAVAVCLIFYGIMGRDGIMMAVTASILCMQTSVEKSIDSGKSNIIGTLMGGALGTMAVVLGIPGYSTLTFILCALIGIVLLIHTCYISRLSGSIVLSCLVYMTIITGAIEPGGIDPISLSLNRIVDSLIGIMVTVFVNAAIIKPPPDMGIPADISYFIRAKNSARTTSWSGGTTSELYIYPENSFYAERNFSFRISTATVEQDESDFTKLPGFKRHLMLLEGELSLEHENHYAIKLNLLEQDFFSGEWQTKSRGKCSDFNLMTADGYAGSLAITDENAELSLSTDEFSAFYCLNDKASAQIFIDNNEPITLELNKDDFLIFKHDEKRDVRKYRIKLSETCIHVHVTKLEEQH